MTLVFIPHYIIHPETKAILPEFDAKGRCYSKVIQGSQTFIVTMKPIEIMQTSLSYYGSSLEGAISGSKSIVGACQAAPIRIAGNIDMYWFSHISPQNDECVWLALHHVHRILPEKYNQAKVMLIDGPSITLDISERKLSDRYDRAEQLEVKITKRTQYKMNFVMERGSGVHFIKEADRNYTVSRDDESE
ncbi:competence protein ComK [Bacillus sp. ISL-47]|uniref:competence protein ComK n=1 Tax=Bacillus sp. ISL-47 TaxID=2819130 RepID=UPI001BE7B8B4|nr:competence protein ComK [Bacillus sp. ISL-47]MBT2686836.1 competence protein ComK [Bacillus sp. ISL-47]MBT2706811.1 competence protein ComK [Pseudomonas sp. ISL-84]